MVGKVQLKGEAPCDLLFTHPTPGHQKCPYSAAGSHLFGKSLLQLIRGDGPRLYQQLSEDLRFWLHGRSFMGRGGRGHGIKSPGLIFPPINKAFRGLRPETVALSRPRR